MAPPPLTKQPFCSGNAYLFHDSTADGSLRISVGVPHSLPFRQVSQCLPAATGLLLRERLYYIPISRKRVLTICCRRRKILISIFNEFWMDMSHKPVANRPIAGCTPLIRLAELPNFGQQAWPNLRPAALAQLQGSRLG